ncbi:MAG: 1-acyl-sn-glycerol-3-phosphate acyltransferase [Lachnospiraceae bacterium]|nr:1-acyl-sn-glycerol-3-phosphate acyltransferase [Lachnospiraceae bacterium]
MIRLILAVLFIVIFLLVSLILIPIGCIIGLFSRYARDRYSQILVSWAFRVVGFIAGARLTVKGKERVPKDEAVLYVANHRSWFDIVLLDGQMFRPTGIVSKKEVKVVPILGWWMIMLDCRFIDRKDLRQSMQVILDCIELIKNGISVLIYPEGTRSKAESELEVAPFKEGSFKIALKSGAKVVPVAIHGTREILEKQFPIVRSSDVTITFLEPIDTKALDKEDQKRIGEICRERIIEVLKEDNK